MPKKPADDEQRRDPIRSDIVLTVPADNQVLLLPFRFSTKQLRYLSELRLEVEAGQLLPQRETAKRAGCSEYAVVKWNRISAFRAAVTQIIAEANEPLIELLQLATIRRGIAGSIKHAELAFRVARRLDPPTVDGANGGQAASAQAAPRVTFVGLPELPSAEQARAMRPPQGSNVIIPAPMLPPTSKLSNG